MLAVVLEEAYMPRPNEQNSHCETETSTSSLKCFPHVYLVDS